MLIVKAEKIYFKLYISIIVKNNFLKNCFKLKKLELNNFYFNNRYY